MRADRKYSINGSKVIMKPTNEKGFSLIEVIMAISILSIGILGVASMQTSALQGNSFANRITDSTNWGQDKMEELLACSYTDPDLDTASNPHEDPDPPSGYTITWNVTDGPITNTKEITVTVRQQGKTTSLLTCIKSQLI